MDSNFKKFIAAYAVYSLAKWISLSALPLLVAQKFNPGGTLVISLALKLLPQVILAPFLATMLLKKGPQVIAIVTILWLAVGQIILPHTHDYLLFQGIILLTGIMDTAIGASVLTWRSQLIPKGKDIAANAFFSVVERASKIIGPGLTTLILWKLSITQSFYALSLLLVVAAIILLITKRQPSIKATPTSSKVNYLSFLKLFMHKPILWAIYIPGLGYAILLGTLNLFLFWSNTKTFHQAESQWTILLTAHGIGAMFGSIIAPKALSWIHKKMPLLQSYLWLSLLRSIGFISLAWISHFGLACTALVCIGLPEMLEVVCFFTLLQRYLQSGEEIIFYTFNMPIFGGFIFLGTLVGGIYTKSLISLQGFWVLSCVLSMFLIIPFLLYNKEPNKIADKL